MFLRIEPGLIETVTSGRFFSSAERGSPLNRVGVKTVIRQLMTGVVLAP
jgi:hypothetical protein